MSYPLKLSNATRLVFVVFALAAVGCTRSMALRGKHMPSLEDRSIAIFTLRTSNQFKPIFRPEVFSIELVPEGKKRGQKFKVGRPFRESKKKFLEYLISVDLKPGTYKIENFTGK